MSQTGDQPLTGSVSILFNTNQNLTEKISYKGQRTRSHIWYKGFGIRSPPVKNFRSPLTVSMIQTSKKKFRIPLTLSMIQTSVHMIMSQTVIRRTRMSCSEPINSKKLATSHMF